MKIFLSSTCYDLTDLRAEIEKFITDKGHESLLSDRLTFPVKAGQHRHDVCIENVELCDLLIIVIDRRYGAPYYKNINISITWAEFRRALETHKKIIAFIRKQIFNERQTYIHNRDQGNPFEPFFTDNIKTFDLIDEIQQSGDGIWIQPFENSVEVKERVENLYETKHSIINEPLIEEPISMDVIPMTVVSGSTASYVNNFVSDKKIEYLDESIIQKAIELIPENETYIGLKHRSEIPNGNDYYYYRPTNPLGGNIYWHVNIDPTALGKAIRDELLSLLERIKSNKNSG